MKNVKASGKGPKNAWSPFDSKQILQNEGLSGQLLLQASVVHKVEHSRVKHVEYLIRGLVNGANDGFAALGQLSQVLNKALGDVRICTHRC